MLLSRKSDEKGLRQSVKGIPAQRKGKQSHEPTTDCSKSTLFVWLQVHVNLMVLEARMQAELLYALRTVNRYMTN